MLGTTNFTQTDGGDGPGQIQFYNGNLYVAGDEGRQIFQYNGTTGGAHQPLRCDQFGAIFERWSSVETRFTTRKPFKIRCAFDLAYSSPTGTTLFQNSPDLDKATNMTIGPQGILVLADANNTLIQEYSSTTGAFLGTLANVARQTKREHSSSIACRLVPCRVEASIHWSVQGPLSSSQSIPLDPAPGEQLSVARGESAEVMGQLTLDPLPTADFDYHFGLNYLVARSRGSVPPASIAGRGFDRRKGWSESWTASTEYAPRSLRRGRFCCGLFPSADLESAAYTFNGRVRTANQLRPASPCKYRSTLLS